MTETKTEFVKRKKSEKRLQAERQVREAYAKCIEIDGKMHHKVGPVHIPFPIKMEPEIEDLYSTIDISKALNMPRERLRDWMVRGFISPSLPSTSKGTIAIFTRNDVLCVALFQKLIDMGLKREVASDYTNQLVLSNLIGMTNFIAVVYTEKDGKAETSLQTNIGDGGLNINIDQTGKAKLGLFDSGLIEDWEGIHIINMLKLGKQVDAALAKIVD
jgi:hypothetical protein